MDINEIKKLIKIVENSKINDFSISEGDLKIKISKNGKVSQTFTGMPMPEIPLATPAPPVATSTPTSEVVKDETPVTNANIHVITSPIVGTFYRAPAPDADPYVKVGDNISSGSVLCIVEAMKLMNEIESDINGKVVKILVDDATPVEFNQPLFEIEKS
jgi:acetyl-CoA carboxylase biotin carboxyl carrier protein